MKKCKKDCKYYSKKIEIKGVILDRCCKKLLTAKERCIRNFPDIIIKDYYKKKCERKIKNKRAEIIEQGCCPDCYAPKPCECD